MEELISELNIWAVLVGGFVYFMIGWLWYGPLFGKPWMAEKGIDGPPGSPDPMIFVHSLLLQILAVFSLALFIEALGIETAINGLCIGLAASAGFILTTMGVNGLYNNMSLRLFAIDAGYHLVGLATAGLIIGAW